ncbi:MAG: glycosyltransferase family 2 protein [Bacteroidia bacterium]
MNPLPDYRKKISVVVPVYNEEENVAAFHKEITDVCNANQFDYEIIFIDDGSTDKTREVIKKLSPVRLITFRRNFGQTAAMDAGFKHAKNDYIVTMDGDGQNDPKDIPQLISYLEENDLDVVSGWRKKRKDSFMKRLVSRGANYLRKFMINDGISDSGCSLKVYKKECFDHLTLYGEMHRFIPAILKIKGFKIGELEVNHRPRTKGKTKYNWTRTFKGFIDMISVWFWNKFAVRPLHLLGGIGLFFLFIGGIFACATIYSYLYVHQDLSNTLLPLMTVFFVITGILLFVLGLISDILVKNYYETTKDISYSIKEITEN